MRSPSIVPTDLVAAFLKGEPSPVIVITMDGSLIYSNTKAQSFLDHGLAAALSSEANTASVHFAMRSSQAVPRRLQYETPEGAIAGLKTTISAVRMEGYLPLAIIRIDADKIVHRFRRLTDKLNAENQKVAESSRDEKVFGRIFNTIAEGVLVCDLNGQVLVRNAAFTAMVGSDARLTTIFGGDGHCAALLARALADTQAGGGYYDQIISTGDGERLEVEISAALAETVDGKIAVLLFRDITERRALERATKLADEANRRRELVTAKAEATQRFLSVMSHELRTPLNGTLAALQLLNDEVEKNSAADELVSLAQRSGDQVLAQVERILEFTRLDVQDFVLRPAAMRLDHFAQDLVQHFEEEAYDRGNAIDLNLLGPSYWRVFCDPALLRDVVFNLMDNAVKFTHEGRIGLNIELEQRSTRRVEVLIRVSDTGAGFDTDELERLTAEFEIGEHSYSRAFDGAGLGLAIVAKAVALLDGRLEAKSGIGVGSVMTVRLSLPLAEMLNDGRAQEPVRSVVTTPKVLVVDDNATNRQVLGMTLDRQDCAVSFARDGKEALSIMNTHSFDTVFMDVSMPEMDGLEATRRYRALHGPELQIIGVTANADPKSHRDCMSAGMDGVLLKPIQIAEVKEIIARLKA